MSDSTYLLIKNALDVSSLRQRTISSNLANVNTPNYKVHKVEFEEYLAEALDENSISLKKTHPEHIGIGNIEDINPTLKRRTGTSVNDNGNNVDIDLEMTELAANEIYYSALTTQVNAKLSSLNYIINR